MFRCFHDTQQPLYTHDTYFITTTNSVCPQGTHNMHVLRSSMASVWNIFFVDKYKKNAEETNYILVFRQWNIGRNHNIKREKTLLKSVANFKYLETTVTNQYFNHDQIRAY
jgi:hypothetical protein